MEKKRNLWVIPTDKPSKLYLSFNNILDLDNHESQNTLIHKNQNIYITSDEEIKDGDYFFNKSTNYIRKYTNCNLDKSDKKIILTTDQDLIKDGVQAIDDEFLQWFVKNPTCEEVEVEKFRSFKEIYSPYEYMIIIPKEESKQKLPIVNGSYGCTIETEKQETLEEVNTSSLENLLENNYDFNVQFHQLKRESIFSFAVVIYGESLSFKEWQEKHYGKYIEISKWQQEQNKNKYSEEDMKEAFENGV
ncbi:hypothetical protein [Flavobacterium sp.]|jgi:hypothetical protein|uniref:hypothetical protein n=1 Tax=Flavobacterium sp. TaxID=239 RepID=UPI0037C108BF